MPLPQVIGMLNEFMKLILIKKVLTIGDGTHEIQFQPKGDTFVDTYSRVDMAPVRELRDSQTGKLIAQLNRQDTEKQFGKRRLTERFVAKGRDGETDIWGIIHWPINFNPSKKYPVVENIYAGPHDHHVPKAFRTGYGHRHAIADAGMIVVQIDGMGTAWRSKEFHDVCFKNLRDAGFPDRIAWLKAAAKRYPQMNLSRVGIYGGSAGGQNAMAALLWHSDFYKVAVADCGCHDNRMDKIWWNEQWMGWPVDDSYRKNSNMENAHLLNGKLMLTLGELDQNVDPASTTQVVGKLMIAGKGHGAGESPWAAKKRLRFLKLHLGVE
jgi:dipeptidyl-peptidase-4